MRGKLEELEKRVKALEMEVETKFNTLLSEVNSLSDILDKIYRQAQANKELLETIKEQTQAIKELAEATKKLAEKKRRFPW